MSHIRESIEDARRAAEESIDEQTKRQHAQRGGNFPGLENKHLIYNSFIGMIYLRRYFSLIIFQAYLRSTHFDTLRSFETFENFVKYRPGALCFPYLNSV